MKSAFELALERTGGKLREISEEKKQKLAEIDKLYQSKLAEAQLSKVAALESSQSSLEHFENLKGHIDPTQLCLKLLSHFIQTQCTKTIGLSKEEIAKLEAEGSQPSSKPKRQSAKKRSSKPRYSNKSITDSIWG